MVLTAALPLVAVAALFVLATAPPPLALRLLQALQPLRSLPAGAAVSTSGHSHHLPRLRLLLLARLQRPLTSSCVRFTLTSDPADDGSLRSGRRAARRRGRRRGGGRGGGGRRDLAPPRTRRSRSSSTTSRSTATPQTTGRSWLRVGFALRLSDRHAAALPVSTGSTRGRCAPHRLGAPAEGSNTLQKLCTRLRERRRPRQALNGASSCPLAHEGRRRAGCTELHAFQGLGTCAPRRRASPRPPSRYQYLLTLIEPYEYRCYWFETFQCLHKVMLTGITIFFLAARSGSWSSS